MSEHTPTEFPHGAKNKIRELTKKYLLYSVFWFEVTLKKVSIRGRSYRQMCVCINLDVIIAVSDLA